MSCQHFCQHSSIVFSKLSFVYYVTIDHTITSAILACCRSIIVWFFLLLNVFAEGCCSPLLCVISGKDFLVLGEFLSLLILMLYKQTFLIVNFALQLTECDLSQRWPGQVHLVNAKCVDHVMPTGFSLFPNFPTLLLVVECC